MGPQDIRPWFRGDLKQLLCALYFVFRLGKFASNPHSWRGVAAAFFSMATAFGVAPEEVLTADDLAVIKEVRR